MKRKLRFFINIATLALCVCAIAIGVYAAQSAKLNAAGTVGFVSHNCDLDIMGYIYGHASGEDGEGVPVLKENKVKLSESALEVRGSAKTLSLGTRYFSDLSETGEVPDIVVELQITNISSFMVQAVVDVENITRPTNVNITVADEEQYKVFSEKNTQNQTQTIKFIISLAKQDGEYVDITKPASSNLSLKITFSRLQIENAKKDASNNDIVVKSLESEVSAIREKLETYAITDEDKCYAEVFPYYITMGKEVATNKDLRWLIIGVYNNGALENLTAEDTAIFQLGKMLNKNYCLLSENILYAKDHASMYYGVPVQTSYSTERPCLNPHGQDANDYATSVIRQYLNGETVAASAIRTDIGDYYTHSPNTSDMVTFSDCYTFNQTTELSLIKARNLGEMYTSDTSNNRVGECPEVAGVCSASDTDKFWLLSYTEYFTLTEEHTKIWRMVALSQNPSHKTSESREGRPTCFSWMLRGETAALYSVRIVNATTDDPNTRLVASVDDMHLGVRPAFILK